MHGRWMRWTRPRLSVRRLVVLLRSDITGARSVSNIPRPHNTLVRSLLSNDYRTEGKVAPLRRQLKDAAKAARTLPTGSDRTEDPDILADWELTVGIEIHAQLNSPRKLFSTATTAPNTEPNSQVAPFDIALPGSLPVLQQAVILPALRAAIALGCKIETVSHFDRKHYFYHDQPAGYQITQYYHPFAKDGGVIMDIADSQDGIRYPKVRIKQVQLEQDTARTQEDDADTALIDFNRCGQALIEIISQPDLHSPRAAAAYVRKVQSILYAVDAVTTGMEQGGLRADVNVSVRRRGDEPGRHAYGPVRGLGQRTEIKNLSTFKGIEEAIKAERDRQIKILEGGGTIEGETRGWSQTNPHETKRLRGKEGEVDYRYLPDADIPPLYLSLPLIRWVNTNLPPTAFDLATMVVDKYGLSLTDARTLVSLDDGERLIYFQDVAAKLASSRGFETPSANEWGRIVGNWVLHELGALSAADEREWSAELVPSSAMANIIYRLKWNQITGASAKLILRLVCNGDQRSVAAIIEQEDLAFSEMSTEVYEEIARGVMEKFPQHVADIVQKGRIGKLQFLMGQMMKDRRRHDMRAPEAERTLRRLILQRDS